MSKKTIVLADNSYTIRRIVELSFSEEEEIELISFENSVNLREKLIELRPAIVLVDIKLPEFNGYEVCRFINNTEGLKNTHVFLLKGGFEPVDENLLKGLRFIDIITKPFDSNALVSTIKNLLQRSPADQPEEDFPSSLPEDLPEVDSITGSHGDEISFSDIKQEIESDDVIIGARERIPSFGMGAGAYADDDVLPSEEITQGTQPERDELAPSIISPEDLDNPFADDISETPGSITEEEMNIRHNIQMQESELEIGSLTQEELDIKKQIGDRDSDLYGPPLSDADLKVSDEDFSEMMQPSGMGREESEFEAPEISTPEEDSFPFGSPVVEEAEEPVEEYTPSRPQFNEIPDLQASEVESEIGLEPDYEPSPSTRKLDLPSMETSPDEEKMPEMDSLRFEEAEPESEPPVFDYRPPSPFEDDQAEVEEITPPPAPSYLDEDMEPEEPVIEIPSMTTSILDEEPAVKIPEFGIPRYEDEIESESTPMEYAVPPTSYEEPEIPGDFEAEISTFKDDLIQREQVLSEPDIEDIRVETAEEEPEIMDYEIPAPPPPPPPAPTRAAPPPPPPPAPPKEPIPPVMKPKPAAPPVIEKTPPPKPAEKVTTAIPGIDNEDILQRVEEKLILAIKEILWEIVPPLAEKIIKEEIEQIKAEVSQSFK